MRTYKADVRKTVLDADHAHRQRRSAGRRALREHRRIEHYETTDAVYNDPALTQRLRAVLEGALEKGNVVTQEPITASEDFSVFVAQGIPGFYLSLGGADPQKYEAAKAAGTQLPSNHSSLFAPDVDPAMHTAIAAEVAMLRDLLKADGG